MEGSGRSLPFRGNERCIRFPKTQGQEPGRRCLTSPLHGRGDAHAFLLLLVCFILFSLSPSSLLDSPLVLTHHDLTPPHPPTAVRTLFRRQDPPILSSLPVCIPVSSRKDQNGPAHPLAWFLSGIPNVSSQLWAPAVRSTLGGWRGPLLWKRGKVQQQKPLHMPIRHLRHTRFKSLQSPCGKGVAGTKQGVDSWQAGKLLTVTQECSGF